MGDSTIKAGNLIFVNIIENTGVTSFSQAHPLLAGTYMISKLVHSIGAANMKPRYT
jgi:hypothetical protein